MMRCKVRTADEWRRDVRLEERVWRVGGAELGECAPVNKQQQAGWSTSKTQSTGAAQARRRWGT
eukprot:350320-Chlamydomonas_euryale.AAC.8